MKVLVKGANGMLGQDLCPVFEDNGLYVIPMGREDLDVTDYKGAKAVIERIKPQIIVHLAAYTNVDKAEDEPEKAFEINETGALNIAKISKELGAIMVYVSTDYVFDGTKNSPYMPDDTLNPINKYGLSKLRGEEAVKNNTDKYYIVRTSWLYGLSGKNFVETIIDLSTKQNEIKVVDDQAGCPTYTVDLSMGILRTIGKPFGINHIENECETTWYDFAKEIFRLKNIQTELIPCTTEEFPRKAKRPKYSVLQNSIEMRPWREALFDYIKYKESLGL